MQKTRFWVTLCVPVEVEDENNGIPLVQTALDAGWAKITDPDGPPEGLVEHVTAGDEGCDCPAVLAENLLPTGHNDQYKTA